MCAFAACKEWTGVLRLLGKPYFLLFVSTCCAFLAFATLHVKLIWSVSLRSDCLGQEEPQFSLPEWAVGSVSPAPGSS